MRRDERIEGDHYTEIEYHQFTRSRGLKLAMRGAGVVTWPVVVPLALVSRASDFIFRTLSESLSLVPYVAGVIVRQEFYRWALTRCGDNVSIGFGTYFYYRDVEIGHDVSIGSYNVFHYCDVGDYALIADGSHFLSGTRYHNFDRTDVPIAKQGGRLRRIRVGDGSWVGAKSVVMSDVGEGAVVGAGSVVSKPVKPYTVVSGNPAKVGPIATSFRKPPSE